MRRPRFILRSLMIAVLVLGGAFAAVRDYLPQPPLVVAHRLKAKDHRQREKMWNSYAGLSKQGVTAFQPGWLNNGTRGEWVTFNHFQPRPRPKPPLQARAFDAECAGNEVKCLALRDYHRALAEKWEYAARHRLEAVDPDPAPPLNVEPSGNKDIAF